MGAGMKLTETTVQKAKAPEAGQAFLRDDKARGLALRVTAGGARTWVWDGRVRGRTRRITLGPSPAVSLAQARNMALDVAARVARGGDPAEERAEERRMLTFGALAERYMTDHAERKRSARNDLAMLRDVLPSRGGAKDLGPAPIPSRWKDRRLGDIAREDMRQLHARISAEAPYRANRVIALIRKMYNLAKVWDAYRGDNPVVGVTPNKERSRDRFLSQDELRRVLEAIEQEPDGRWRAYFKLLLLLGPRKSELLQARREHFDLAARTWRLPETKAGRPHLVPLPSPAVEIVESLIAGLPESPWLFPSSASASGHAEEPKAVWQRVRARAGIPDVRVHDLRRTLGSWLASSGYGLPLIGRVLNHSQPATTAIYARMDLEPVRRALEANARLMLGDAAAGPAAPTVRSPIQRSRSEAR